MTAMEASDDPFERHFHRDPLPGAGIRIVHLTDLSEDRALALVAPLIQAIQESGRPVECRIVAPDGDVSQALCRGLEGASLPLVLITTACEPFTMAHLAPLLGA